MSEDEKPKPIHSATFNRAITRLDQTPELRPTIIFAGRSNVGKSSLINSLVQRKNLARTSNTPGRTREIHFYDIEERYWFVDLPGYGYAKVSKQEQKKWAPMMERFLRGAKGVRLVIPILDARRDPTPEDLQMVAWLQESEHPYIFAITKIDKLGANDRRKCIARLMKLLQMDDDAALIPVSSLTKEGLDDLLRVVRAVLAVTPEEEKITDSQSHSGTAE